MEFFTRSKYPDTIAYPESKKIIPTFALEINKETGKKELVKSGATNIYEKIQASKDETLVYNILERFNNGDIEALNKARGIYGDFTNMPKTLAEAQQQLINAENTFNDLPIDVRKEFNYSTSEFLASMANGQFEQIMSKYIKEKVQAIEQPTAQPTETQQETGGIKYE